MLIKGILVLVALSSAQTNESNSTVFENNTIHRVFNLTEFAEKVEIRLEELRWNLAQKLMRNQTLEMFESSALFSAIKSCSPDFEAESLPWLLYEQIEPEMFECVINEFIQDPRVVAIHKELVQMIQYYQSQNILLKPSFAQAGKVIDYILNSERPNLKTILQVALPFIAKIHDILN